MKLINPLKKCRMLHVDRNLSLKKVFKEVFNEVQSAGSPMKAIENKAVQHQTFKHKGSKNDNKRKMAHISRLNDEIEGTKLIENHN